MNPRIMIGALRIQHTTDNHRYVALGELALYAGQERPPEPVWTMGLYHDHPQIDALTEHFTLADIVCGQHFVFVLQGALVHGHDQRVMLDNQHGTQ
jgi:hypothetical protein